MKSRMKNRIAVIFLMIFTIPLFAYFSGWFLINLYITTGASKLIKLEESGMLSKTYGYVWQEININKDMNQVSQRLTGDSSARSSLKLSEKKMIQFPSLSAVRELNRIKSLYKTIRITDRYDIPLTQLQTSHTCVELSDINDILLASLVETEDNNFYKRKKSWDYNALVRSACLAGWKSLRSLRLHKPRGSSTIHMQVARFLLMKYDGLGYAYAERSISRKLQELKLSQALKLTYSNNEILTTYINHCVSAGKGMRGYHDISRRLFGVSPDSLNIAQSLYLARLVKWNRHIPSKIIQQIKTSMPSLARRFEWSKDKQDSILIALDTLRFRPPQNIIPQNSHLLDLANEYWKMVCKLNGIADSELPDIDIANPESMIRRYGNLNIKLTIDSRLQSLLEKAVNNRGFGPDTTIRTDIRIASEGKNLPVSSKIPGDTLRKIIIMTDDTIIHDYSTGNSVNFGKNDTLVLNIRYKKYKDHIRRSVFMYKRDTITVRGQYFAYAVMNSKTRELLAYYSKDQLGSRLQSLHTNRTPNGSSTSKPVIYAMAYDWGIYKSTDMTSDDLEIGDTCDWARSFFGSTDNPSAMTYLHSGKDGYTVHNHHKKFDGYDYVYNHLSNSNNIVAVETMYRLNTDLTNDNIQSEKASLFLQRTGIRGLSNHNKITGPSFYAGLAAICADSAINDSVRQQYKDKYSTALGTLELSLYEQMHLFGILYDGKLTSNPSKHPDFFIKNIRLSGNNVPFKDSISWRTVIENIDSINPVHLALHKRLISDPGDNLHIYDFCSTNDEPVKSNFAKSGTTDDIIRHYYSDVTDTSKTCYGLWNAILRISLSRNDMIKVLKQNPDFKSKNLLKLCSNLPEKEDIDITIACIGECDKKHTGFPDGKSLHGYVSRSFLQKFGIPCTTGFYSEYEKQIIEQTSDKVKFANIHNESDLSNWSKFMIKFKTGFNSDISGDDVVFEKSRKNRIRLKKKSYRTMLKFGPHMGNNSKQYVQLVEKLKEPENMKDITDIIDEIEKIDIRNQFLKKELQSACKSLRASAQTLLSDKGQN